MRRRILFVNHAAVLGGAELSLIDIAWAYQKSSAVLLLENGPLRACLEEKGVTTRVSVMPTGLKSLGRSSGFVQGLASAPGALWLARAIARESRAFDLVHANTQKAFLLAAMGRFFGGSPVVWHLRDILGNEVGPALRDRVIASLANRYASMVIVNSNATGEAFIAQGGRADKVKVVYNGIRTGDFEGVTLSESALVREQFGIGEAPLVGCFSRLASWKGQHILLEAIREMPGVHVLFVGADLFGETEYEKQLREVAACRELAGRTHWLGFRHDIPRLMMSCDIIVHSPTEPEPFGRVVAEGMLAMRPVIASATGGIPELIADRVTGRLVPPGDAIALRQVIGEVLEQPQEALAMAQRAAASAQRRFSVDNLLESYDTAVEQAWERSCSGQHSFSTGPLFRGKGKRRAKEATGD
jgi:glycosyltransferase involved in cell wall biosynthesis